MNIEEAIKSRHSVRQYTDKKIDGETKKLLADEIAACNSESGLNIQLVTDEENAFGGFMAKYGHFENVRNYIALIGKKSDDLHEKIGYYGERVALFAQSLGLNTCWVAMSYSKGKAECEVKKGEKLVCVLSLGYGKTQGVAHRSKKAEELYKSDEPTLPYWFEKGLEGAMLAPTATNQQKFLITLKNGNASISSTGGFYSKVDLGIVKYHFEAMSEHKIEIK